MKVYQSIPTCSAIVIEGGRLIRFGCGPAADPILIGKRALELFIEDPSKFEIYELIEQTTDDPPVDAGKDKIGSSIDYTDQKSKVVQP